MLLTTFDTPSDKAKLSAIEKYAYLIGSIENPTEEMKLEAVRQKDCSIMYIKNPIKKTATRSYKADTKS